LLAVFLAKFIVFYGALMNFFAVGVKPDNMAYGQFEAAAEDADEIRQAQQD